MRHRERILDRGVEPREEKRSRIGGRLLGRERRLALAEDRDCPEPGTQR